MSASHPFRSLAVKLTLAFLVVGLAGSVFFALAVQLQAQRRFNQFVLDRYELEFVSGLVEYYAEHGSWSGLQKMVGVGPEPTRDFRYTEPWTLVDVNGLVVLGRPELIGQVIEIERQGAIPVELEGDVIGWLVLDIPESRYRPGTPERDFMDSLSQSIFISSLIATTLALSLGILLARTIAHPVRELTAATQIVASGNLGYKVAVKTKDELGQLASSFNQMSTDLARLNDLRRQMAADIAHELRTPLSVILGYTEGMSDGKLQASAAVFQVMHEEAQHLQRLVEDLRTLSLADAGELSLMQQACSPVALLKRVSLAHEPLAQEKEIMIQTETAPELPMINVDPDRIVQVLSNLINNALRHTPRGGNVRLSAIQDGANIIMTVGDSGSGITPEDLPYVFERFYKASKSREYGQGESGLGLAIARSIVEAHGGTIAVESQVGRGTEFSIIIPVSTELPSPGPGKQETPPS